jgi:hypothetical protein
MTPPKTRDSVIDKVRKLLALAADGNGATPAERENAQRRAADLMTRHDLAMHEMDDADRGSIGEDRDTIEGMTEQWRGELGGRVCKAMGGDWFYTPISRTRRAYTLVGRPDTIEFTRVLVDALIPWLEVEANIACATAQAKGETGTCSRCDGAGETRRLKGGGYSDDVHTCPTCDGSGAVPLNARVFKREFYDAATLRIATRLSKQRKDTANEVKGKGTGVALVKNDKAAIDAYYKSIGLKLSSSSSYTTGGTASGRASGRDAGDRASLSPTRTVAAGAAALPKGKS